MKCGTLEARCAPCPRVCALRRHRPAGSRLRQLRSIRKLRTPRTGIQTPGERTIGERAGKALMARLKTDWILFLTILAMVAFGLVMVYSASSAIAELRNGVAPYYFAVRQLGWALVSFFVLMYFKRLDYRRLNTPAWAFSGLGIVLGLLVIGVLLRLAPPLVSLCRRRLVPAFRIRQAGADRLSGLLSGPARARHQRSPHAAAGLRRGGDAGGRGGGRRSGHGHGARDHRRDRVLGGGSGEEVYASRRG